MFCEFITFCLKQFAFEYLNTHYVQICFTNLCDCERMPYYLHVFYVISFFDGGCVQVFII